MNATDLVLIGILFTAINTLIGLFGYRRTNMPSKVTVWDSQIARLEDENAAQALQIADLQSQAKVAATKYADLLERVTSAGKIVELTDTVDGLTSTVGKWNAQSQKNHEELLAQLERMKGPIPQ